MLFFLTAILTHLCLLTIISRAEESFDCTGYEDDSFHPIYDADDCRHYWHCIYVDTVYMHAVRRVCPSGTEFDPILRQCETSSLVRILDDMTIDFLFLCTGRLYSTKIPTRSTNIDNNSSMEMAILKIIFSKTLENEYTQFSYNSSTSGI